MTNLYTFNPFTGVTAGVALVCDGVDPRTQRPVPPHIACGSNFIAVEKRHVLPLGHDGRLYDVSLSTIHPMSGKKPFHVLMPKASKEDKLYCLVDSRLPKGTRLKVRPDEVRARYMFAASDGVHVVMYDNLSQTYLFEFAKDAAVVDVWYETGYIARMVRRGDTVVQLPLSDVEIAQERVLQYQEQADLMDTGHDQKRRHGIIAAAVRLLVVSNGRNVEDVYVDFLVDQVPYLTESLRGSIRSVLLQKKHPLAGHFVTGSETNVVPLRPNSGADKKRSLSLARKRQRSEEDRARHLLMRGPNGQQQSSRQGKKK